MSRLHAGLSLDKRNEDVVKLTYTLMNPDDEFKLVPPGRSWKWIVEMDDESELFRALVRLKHKVRQHGLRLANLYILSPSNGTQAIRPHSYLYKGQIIYDDEIRLDRIIHKHIDMLDNALAEARMPPFRTTQRPPLESSSHA